MNLANKLTLSRILVIPVFIVMLSPGRFGLPEAAGPWMQTLALVLFIAASITDYYDGMLARRHGWITSFGKLMDPLADKVLVMAAFVGLVELGVFPAWMVILVLAREFLITGLRTLAVIKGRVLAADKWGKSKTVWQLTTIITALVFVTAEAWLRTAGLWERVVVRQWDIAWLLSLILHVMMFMCVVLTVFSGWHYCRANWDLLREE